MKCKKFNIIILSYKVKKKGNTGLCKTPNRKTFINL